MKTALKAAFTLHSKLNDVQINEGGGDTFHTKYDQLKSYYEKLMQAHGGQARALEPLEENRNDPSRPVLVLIVSVGHYYVTNMRVQVWQGGKIWGG